VPNLTAVQPAGGRPRTEQPTPSIPPISQHKGRVVLGLSSESSARRVAGFAEMDSPLEGAVFGANPSLKTQNFPVTSENTGNFIDWGLGGEPTAA